MDFPGVKFKWTPTASHAKMQAHNMDALLRMKNLGRARASGQTVIVRLSDKDAAAPYCGEHQGYFPDLKTAIKAAADKAKAALQTGV